MVACKLVFLRKDDTPCNYQAIFMFAGAKDEKVSLAAKYLKFEKTQDIHLLKFNWFL